MGAIASQITNLTIVYSIVYSDADQRKHQSSASLAFVQGIHRGPVNSPHKWPVTRKMFPFDDVIMLWVWGKLMCAKHGLQHQPRPHMGLHISNGPWKNINTWMSRYHRARYIGYIFIFILVYKSPHVTLEFVCERSDDSGHMSYSDSRSGIIDFLCEGGELWKRNLWPPLCGRRKGRAIARHPRQCACAAVTNPEHPVTTKKTKPIGVWHARSSLM